MFITRLPSLFKTCPFHTYSGYGKIIRISRWTFFKSPTTVQRSLLTLTAKVNAPTAVTFAPRSYFHTRIGHKTKLLENVFDIKVLPKRHLHPAVWVVVRPVFKLIAVLTGRGFRKWWKDLPPNKRKYFLDKLRKNNVKVGAVISFLGLLTLFYYLNHIQEAPITKRERFIAFSTEQFKQIGDAEFKKVCQEFEQLILPANHPATRRVASVVNRLLDANKDIKEIHNKEWTIAVVNDDMENAFVLPNGQIFVFGGMLKLCSNNDQLGSLLAHEMSHCILGHAAENFSLAHLLDCAMIILITMIWAILPSDYLALFTHWLTKQLVDIMLQLPYNRKIETEADEVGLKLAAKACFDVRESSAFWSKMAALNKTLKDMPNIEFLSTHPSHEKRSQHLDGLMDEALKLRTECGCYRLRSADPRLNIEMLSKMLDEERKKYRINKPIVFVTSG